jgi:hypothetical protein
MTIRDKYYATHYRGYTLWDDEEEYEAHDLDGVGRITLFRQVDNQMVLMVIAHGGEHPLTGLPEERTFLELTMEQFQQLATAVKGVEQELGKRGR